VRRVLLVALLAAASSATAQPAVPRAEHPRPKLAMKPKIKMLAESAPRAGFFESEQFASVRRHLPEELQPVVTFAYHTGCRMQSEILSLEWRNVEFRAGDIRLDAGTAKNGDGRVFPMTNDLPTCLQRSTPSTSG
jgi:integrase